MVKTHRIRRPADPGHNLVSAFTDNIFISSQGEMLLDWRRLWRNDTDANILTIASSLLERLLGFHTDDCYGFDLI